MDSYCAKYVKSRFSLGGIFLKMKFNKFPREKKEYIFHLLESLLSFYLYFQM